MVASGLSFLTTSKIRHRDVALSRPHIFHAVVFPWPITVSEHKGPFCTKFPINKQWKCNRGKEKKLRSSLNYTFSRDAQGPIMPWTLISFEQFISNIPLHRIWSKKNDNQDGSLNQIIILWKIQNIQIDNFSLTCKQI